MQFKEAHAVWGENLITEWNQMMGFRTDLKLECETELTISIAARSYYRVFINGKFYAKGPAQTAHEYCRVDRFTDKFSGDVRIAIEVLACSKPLSFSFDCTLEPGMLTAEVIANGAVIRATGADGEKAFRCKELLYREPYAELMSHCRNTIEICEFDTNTFNWLTASTDGMSLPVKANGVVKEYLPRRAPYPTYNRVTFENLIRISDTVKSVTPKPYFNLGEVIHSDWQKLIKQKIVCDVASEVSSRFTGAFSQNGQTYSVSPGKYAAALTFDLGNNMVGFFEIDITAAEDTILDIVHGDIINAEGEIENYSYMSRFKLKAGSYQILTQEPHLVRYLRMIFRTSGTVELAKPRLVEYTYPDAGRASFRCSDQELNRIYDASRRTLVDNTLEIFMDCPERERGGWLCDSLFTARAAFTHLGDLSVERDFLENFFLTNPDKYDHAFFPEAYPGTKARPGDPGIRTWSFWLVLELCEYYRRSADREFVDSVRPRLERFIEGVLSYRGEGGLIENLPEIFIDWSLSNEKINTQPVSLPTNALVAYMLEEAAALYDNAEWDAAAQGIRSVIAALAGNMAFPMHGLTAAYADAIDITENGYVIKNTTTEAGITLAAWSGYNKDDKSFISRIVKTMGTCPEQPADVNVGKANLFIGLAIRHDLLSRLGEKEKLVRELKDVYMNQVIHGPGTLFEKIAAGSGCHGFNGHAGTLLTRDVLGIGEPNQLEKTVKITPYVPGITWASGSICCLDGTICADWRADPDEKTFILNVSLPGGWTPVVELPASLVGWNVTVNK